MQDAYILEQQELERQFREQQEEVEEKERIINELIGIGLLYKNSKGNLFKTCIYCNTFSIPYEDEYERCVNQECTMVGLTAY